MSNANFAEAPCSKCGETLSINRWDSLNGELDPEAKESLLKGTLFSVTCPECGEINHIVYPVLYHDMANRLLVQYAPNRDEADDYIASAADALAGIKAVLPSGEETYTYRIVFSPNELREKARVFDYGLDDRVVELTKFICALDLHKTRPELAVTSAYFVIDEKEDFHVQFLLTDDRSCIMGVAKTMYDDIAKSFAAAIKEKSEGCYVIDSGWAASALK
ncbi:MAG: hypothetical protein GX683_05420 [Ruminococcaceae bacterium]|nr:hypothetical protein [Oscillospiraceae bacterium]